MKDRMKRFLSSIGLTNFDDYDMDFVSCTKSPYDNDLFLFEVEKDTLWDYKKLDIFLKSLVNITSYQYRINYIYKQQINLDYITSFVKDVYFNLDFNVLDCEFAYIFGELNLKLKKN